MDFFEHQDSARRKSISLLFLFLFAVTIVIIAVNAAIYFIFKFSNPYQIDVNHWWLGKPALITASVTLAVIVGGTLVQYIRLGKGGKAIALMTGATPVSSTSNDSQTLTYINVVEEMSIAAGLPIPSMFIMEKETSINAFVAGYSPSDSVIVVTRGALQNLSRSQLQGVVGHEFSHLLNSDTIINLRLMALLAGILFIGEIGQFLMRSSGTRSGYRRRRSKEDGGLFLIGLALFAIGYIGVFMGRIIKAAVSRQREFLADASSVQFTRNPEGIAGALYEIELHSNAAYLDHTMQAENMNHMCFGETVRMSLSGWLASHPAIKDRINAIGPTLYPRLRSEKRKGAYTPAPKAAPSPGAMETTSGFIDVNSQPTPDSASPASLSMVAAPVLTNSAAIVKNTGTVMPKDVDYAKQLISAIPSILYKMAHSQNDSALVIIALLSNVNEGSEKLTRQILESKDLALAPPSIGTQEDELKHLISQLNKRLYMPLIELCAATLRNHSEEFKKAFLIQLAALAKSDGKVSLFEFLALSYLDHQLNEKPTRPKMTKVLKLAELENEISILFALIEQAGKTSEKIQQASEVINILRRLCGNSSELYTGPLSTRLLSQCLKKLRNISPLLKRPLLEAVSDLILADKQVTPREYEILRVLASCLDCPMPPLAIPS